MDNYTITMEQILSKEQELWNSYRKKFYLIVLLQKPKYLIIDKRK